MRETTVHDSPEPNCQAAIPAGNNNTTYIQYWWMVKDQHGLLGIFQQWQADLCVAHSITKVPKSPFLKDISTIPKSERVTGFNTETSRDLILAQDIVCLLFQAVIQKT